MNQPVMVIYTTPTQKWGVFIASHKGHPLPYGWPRADRRLPDGTPLYGAFYEHPLQSAVTAQAAGYLRTHLIVADGPEAAELVEKLKGLLEQS